MNFLYMPFDALYIYLVLPAFVLSLIAQFMVKHSFKKYSKQRTLNGMTGAQAAAEVLRRQGVSGVRIERVSGSLTDHFDPRSNTIRLSQSVYDAPTVAAVGVAAHEAGHAIQYARNYAPIKLRAAIIHVSKFGSMLSMPLIILGFFMDMMGLITIGLVLFATVALFQLVTLPVEFNASHRAVSVLDEHGFLRKEELPACKKVLASAALTYVAALAVSVAQLLRLFLVARRRR
ncbi:MAG: zinc metallopeptidase [Oscillospiraceae bacterium]|nr:zinc metallopeptidase [Oscillospiraceae bacterium]